MRQVFIKSLARLPIYVFSFIVVLVPAAYWLDIQPTMSESIAVIVAVGLANILCDLIVGDQMPKHISLEDILTPSEIEQARMLYSYFEKRKDIGSPLSMSFNEQLVSEIVQPNMARINAALGQENDPRYIGYAIEYCLMREGKRNATT